MGSLSRKLLQLMLLSLGLTEADIKQTDPLGLTQVTKSQPLRLNWYPICPEPDKAMGLATHTDRNMVTILYQGKVSGLQVLRDEDQHGSSRWVTVPPLPGALVVNVGDMGHILSNGRFKNVAHRAVVNQNCSRLSVSYFWSPEDNVTVVPIVSGSTARPVYRAVTWPEYRSIVGQINDKAIDSLKLAKEE